MRVYALNDFLKMELIWSKIDFQRTKKMREYQVFGSVLGEFFSSTSCMTNRDALIVINFDNEWFLRFPSGFTGLISFGEAKYLLDLVILALSDDKKSRWQRSHEFFNEDDEVNLITEQSPVIVSLGIAQQAG